MPSARLPALTGMRGVAAAVITLFHVEVLRVAARGPSGHTPILNHGWAAVDLFFVLSAFLLAPRFFPRAAGAAGGTDGKLPFPDRWTLRDYARRRFLRVAPPYWLSIPLAVAVSAALGRPAIRGRDLWTHALFVHGLFADTITTVNAVYWTLGVEAQFYVALPLLAWLLSRPSWPWTFAALAAVTFGVRAGALGHYALGVAAVNLPGFLLHFAAGILAARAYQEGARVPQAVLWLAALALVAVPLAALVPPGSLLQGRESWWANLLVRPSLGLGVACALLAACRSERAGRALAWPPVAWLGEASYSLFLLHLPVLAAVAFVAGTSWPAMAVGAALALAAAAAFHAGVERPFQRRAQAPARQRPPGPGAEPL